MAMKKWPKNRTKTVYCQTVIDPLVDAVKHCYNLKRINQDKDVDYNGYPLGARDRSTCSSPKHTLKAKTLRYIEGFSDRSAIEEILIIAFRLGIEQGRRAERKGS